jgi:hypothetical protein
MESESSRSTRHPAKCRGSGITRPGTTGVRVITNNSGEGIRSFWETRSSMQDTGIDFDADALMGSAWTPDASQR